MPAPSYRQRNIATDGGSLHCLDWSPVDPASQVLLLHGFNQSAHSWDEVAPQLARHHRVVAFDQRGHGQSARAADGDYSRAAMVADVGRVADALGLEKLTVIGMSMGATHAIGFAVAQPQRVGAIAVIDYAPEVQRAGVDKITLMLMRSWSSLDEAVAEVRQFNPRRSEANVHARLTHTLAPGPDGRWTWRVDPAFATQGRFHEGPAAMWQQVRSVRCPALVLRGEQSDVLSPEMAERMREALGEAELVTIPGAGHSVPGDAPGACTDALLTFCDAHP